MRTRSESNRMPKTSHIIQFDLDLVLIKIESITVYSSKKRLIIKKTSLYLINEKNIFYFIKNFQTSV